MLDLLANQVSQQVFHLGVEPRLPLVVQCRQRDGRRHAASPSAAERKDQMQAQVFAVFLYLVWFHGKSFNKIENLRKQQICTEKWT